MHRKGLVIGILILMLGVNIGSTFAGDVDVKTMSSISFDGNILYVGGSGPNNYTSIQSAIDDAVDGDTVFVYDDSSPYYENVIVHKSINLIGEDRDTTVIDGSDIEDVVHVSADWVNINGLTIRNSGSYYVEEYAGITIRTNFATISDNNIISNNHIGINLRDSSNNIITGNTISWNNWEGIFLIDSSSNIITGNTISSNNFDGINLWDGSNSNIITDNIITSNNEDGIDIHGSSNVITGNTITSSYNNGIILRGDSNIITGNIISNNEYGIYLDNASINTILKNNILDNERDAIFRNSFLNRWKQNYWDRTRILPKLIFGKITIGPIWMTWINIDWFPAQEPYDI